MAGFLTVIGFIIAAIIMVAAFACLIVVLQYIMWFHGKQCKHCKHTMEYRGLKPDENNGHYLFHCPHCGAWQQIPREQFFRDLTDCKPNEQTV